MNSQGNLNKIGVQLTFTFSSDVQNSTEAVINLFSLITNMSIYNNMPKDEAIAVQNQMRTNFCCLNWMNKTKLKS